MQLWEFPFENCYFSSGGAIPVSFPFITIRYFVTDGDNTVADLNVAGGDPVAREYAVCAEITVPDIESGCDIAEGAAAAGIMDEKQCVLHCPVCLDAQDLRAPDLSCLEFGQRFIGVLQGELLDLRFNWY
jgi:hypothetical protein